MDLFKENLVTNLRVALTLQPITEVILMNHQDCGAFKAFLPYVGYPQDLGHDNAREIEVQAEILTLAHAYIREQFPNMLVRINLIDINGAVAEYNINQKVWTLVYAGKGRDLHQLKQGLWYGMKRGDMTQL
jgi:carbonic anhydrase